MIKNRIYPVILTAIFSSIISLTTFSDAFAQMEEVESQEEVIVDDSIQVGEGLQIAPVVSEYIPEVSDEVLAERLKVLQKDISLSYNKTIRGFIDYFTVKNRRYPLVMERRKNLYFPIFEETLKKHNMPDELKYLAIVESGLNPRAVSRVGAAGLWQFMPVTGREYSLYQDEYIDERLDPAKSTDAACRYLKEAYKVFGDWHLAIASYNCGMGNVRRAIRKSGYKDSFWEVYRHLPQETRAYVPQFVALTYVMNHLEDHNIIADSIEYPMEFDTILVSRQPMNLDVLCTQLGVCPDEFLKLNPAIKKTVIPAKATYTIRIPADKREFLALNRTAIMDSCSTKYLVIDTTNINESLNVALEGLLMADKPKTMARRESSDRQKIVYVVRKGDALGKICNRFSVTVADVKRWNRFRSNTIRSGQRLTIYTSVAYNTKVKKSNNYSVAKSKGVSSKNKRHYYVQPGDTLWTISQKNNGISVEKIKRLNKLKGNEIKPGQKLILG